MWVYLSLTATGVRRTGRNCRMLCHLGCKRAKWDFGDESFEVVMSKDEFIRLGIRVIGFYWLMRLILLGIMFLYVLVMWVMSTMGLGPEGRYIPSMIVYLFSFPVPLLLCVYFLFFGGYVHKFIDRFVLSCAEEVLDRNGCCEVIARFTGLWFIGKLIYYTTSPFVLGFRSLLTMRLIYPESYNESSFAMFSKDIFQVSVIVSVVINLLIMSCIAWYFLKRGKMFIDLLGRVWVGKKDI